VQQEVQNPALARRERPRGDRSQTGDERARGACAVDSGAKNAEPGDDDGVDVMLTVVASGEVALDQTVRIVPALDGSRRACSRAPAQFDQACAFAIG
jgi:hypothetical protein